MFKQMISEKREGTKILVFLAAFFVSRLPPPPPPTTLLPSIMLFLAITTFSK
jgi:hypothetical protein